MATLWYGGTIYTLIEEGHTVEAVLTENGKIVALGKLYELRGQYEEHINHEVNLNGEVMFPGFVDSHLHIIGHGEKLLRLDLSDCRSKQEIIMKVQKYAESIPVGEWIVAEGWDENKWRDDKTLLCVDLDAILPHHPTILKRVCRHVLVANTAAMNAAHFDSINLNAYSGVVGRDERGQLTGVFKEDAQQIILNTVPTVSSSYIKRALRLAIVDAYTYGLTGGHSEDLSYYNGFQKTYDAFTEVIQKEERYFRAHLLVHYKVLSDFQKSGGHYLKGNEWVEFGAVKIFADGSLGGRTALLSHPYQDDPTTSGVAIHTEKELNELVAEARKYGLPIAVHAIGDLAIEMVLTAIENHPLPLQQGRDRLIHAQIMREDLIQRAKKLPLVLDIQPGFIEDYPWVVERIGKQNIKYGYAWRTLMNAGLLLAGGSDAPIDSINPLNGIYAAVSRMSANQQHTTAYVVEEALTVYEALTLYTKGSALATCHEDDYGMINHGFAADFTILEEDLFSCDYDRIPHIQVTKTVIGGKIVYSKE